MTLGSAESKDPRLITGEITFEVFQLMRSQYLSDTDGRMDGHTAVLHSA